MQVRCVGGALSVFVQFVYGPQRSIGNFPSRGKPDCFVLAFWIVGSCLVGVFSCPPQRLSLVSVLSVGMNPFGRGFSVGSPRRGPS